MNQSQWQENCDIWSRQIENANRQPAAEQQEQLRQDLEISENEIEARILAAEDCI